MRQDERETLRRRCHFSCGYCGVRESDVGAELTVDHFQPRSHGGSHEPENWVYCCHACNEFKGDSWGPESPRRILHPLRDDMVVHLVEQDDGTLQALSETGVFHIETLHLNRNSSRTAVNGAVWKCPATPRAGFSNAFKIWKNKCNP